jgi:sugar phosphate isomerase/epimerase
MDRKLSFTTMGTPELDHRGAIELALELGLGGVDLRCADHLGEIRPGSDDAHLRAVHHDFERAGLSIPGVLCYHAIGSEDDGWIDAYGEHVADHLRLAAAIGAQAIRVWGVRPGEGRSSKELVPGTAQAIGDALARDDSGVGIVMQNHLGFGTARDAVAIADHLDDPRFGLVYSPDHTLLYEPAIDETLAEQVRGLTHEVYVADLVRGNDGHRWVFPGEGEVPLRETVAELDAAGFSGFFSFKWEKIWNPDLPDARAALPRFLAFMRSL